MLAEIATNLTWLERKGFDAIGNSDRKTRGLVGFGLVVVDVPNGWWPNPPMDRIRDELRAAERAEWPKVVMAATDDGPKSFLFKTRAQGMGILQIVGFTDEPTKGVKIRYKMVQQTNRQGAKNAKVGEEKKGSSGSCVGRV